MRIGLLNCNWTNNAGDDLIYDMLMSRIHSLPGAEFWTLTYGRMEHYPERKIWSMWHEPQKAIQLCDALIVGPGGLFPGIAVPHEWLGGGDPIELSWLDDLPVFGVGVGYLPLPEKVEERAEHTTRFISHLNWVWCRDNLLSPLCGDIPHTVAPDVAYLALPSIEEFVVDSSSHTHIVIIVSRTQTPTLGEMIQATKGLAQGHGSVLLVPGAAGREDMDVLLCQAIVESVALPNVNAIHDVVTWRELARRIGQAHLVVTTRAHPAIIADMLGINCIMYDSWNKYTHMREVSHAATQIVASPEELMAAINNHDQAQTRTTPLQDTYNNTAAASEHLHTLLQGGLS